MPRLMVDWRPVRLHRNFRLLIIGQLFSLLGSNVTMVAVPFQVYRETHSSLWVGLASAIQLPVLIAGSLWGGAYGDRFDKRRLLVLGTLLAAVASVGLALNAQLGGRHFLLLVALAATSAGVVGFTGPVRSAAIPQMLGTDDLVSAYSIYQLIINFAAVAGPALAGVLLAAVGLSWCYYLDAATFVMLAGLVLLMSPLPKSADHVAARLLHAIRDGFTYVRRHPTLQAIYLADTNAMVFGLPRALFPAMALSVYHGGTRTLGLLYAAPGVGAVAIALAAGWMNHVQRRGRLIVLVISGYGLCMTLFGVVHWLWFGLLVLATAGALDVISAVLRNTMLQLAISDEFRSRISSIQLSVVTGGPRLGDFESGAVAALSSTEFSVVSGGLACIAGVWALALRRRYFWRDEIRNHN